MRISLMALVGAAVLACGGTDISDPKTVEGERIDLDITVDWLLVREDAHFQHPTWSIWTSGNGLVQPDFIASGPVPENGIASIQVRVTCDPGSPMVEHRFELHGTWQLIPDQSPIIHCYVRFQPLCTEDHQDVSVADLGDLCEPPDDSAAEASAQS